MKGVVFNILEAFIVENWGEDAYDDILDQCPLHTQEPFVGPGTYPDADLFTIAAKAAETVGASLPDALRLFGRFAFPHLASKLPEIIAEHKSPASLLSALESVIHVEVRKLMPDAVTPTFDFVDIGDGRLRLEYHSGRKLCHLVEGLLEGVATFYGQQVEYRQATCMHDGAAACTFEVKFSAASGEVAA